MVDLSWENQGKKRGGVRKRRQEEFDFRVNRFLHWRPIYKWNMDDLYHPLEVILSDRVLCFRTKSTVTQSQWSLMEALYQWSSSPYFLFQPVKHQSFCPGPTWNKIIECWASFLSRIHLSTWVIAVYPPAKWCLPTKWRPLKSTSRSPKSDVRDFGLDRISNLSVKRIQLSVQRWWKYWCADVGNRLRAFAKLSTNWRKSQINRRCMMVAFSRLRGSQLCIGSCFRFRG